MTCWAKTRCFRQKCIFYKNALKYNGELYMCLKKIMHVLIALISNKVLLKPTKPRHHWTPQLIRSMKIFVWCHIFYILHIIHIYRFGLILLIYFTNNYNKYKEKLVILQSTGIIAIKSKETTVIAYTCRYSRGHLILIIQSCQGLYAHYNICRCRWSPLFPYFL